MRHEGHETVRDCIWNHFMHAPNCTIQFWLEACLFNHILVFKYINKDRDLSVARSIVPRKPINKDSIWTRESRRDYNTIMISNSLFWTTCIQQSNESLEYMIYRKTSIWKGKYTKNELYHMDHIRNWRVQWSTPKPLWSIRSNYWSSSTDCNTTGKIKGTIIIFEFNYSKFYPQ